tara:strand:- start:44 stop:157 length:114 start_codon:yes stop_codon:yes gene_type:complete
MPQEYNKINLTHGHKLITHRNICGNIAHKKSPLAWAF